MKNARIHEALCLLFPSADQRTAWKLEQGPHTNFEIAITEWNLPDQQPTQAEIDAVYAQLSQIDALAAIEAKYEAVLGRLRAAMEVAMLADGPGMDAKITALRAEWSSASSAQSAEIAALIGG